MFEVLIHEEANKFIESLPIKMQVKVDRTIELLRIFGYNLPLPHSKKLKGLEGLFELRVKQGSNICRLFYFHLEGRTYIITSGYVKKSDKTSKQEIQRALSIKAAIQEKHDEAG